jgi:type IV pilus modification protein PilV
MRTRDGFSLVEVMVALVMLTAMMLGATALAGRMIRTSTSANIQVTAGQLAEDRVDFVRLDPQYDSLSVRYAGTENPVTGYPGYTRTTAVTRTTTVTTNGTTDYITMTVRVTHQQLSTPVARTVVITTP